MKLQIALLSIIALACVSFSNETSIWEKRGHGIYESDIRTMHIDQSDNDAIYAGTSKALYRSKDGGNNYRVLMRPSGKRSGVNDIFISMEHPKTIYVATDTGLYESNDGGENWKRNYYSSDAELQRCLSVIRHSQKIYLGTSKGLFEKKVKEVSWHKRNGKLNDHPIYHLTEDDLFLYGATGQTIYRLDKQTSKIKKVYSIGIGERQNEDSAEDNDLNNGNERFIKFIFASESPNRKIFAATTKGIQFSSDHGKNWQSLPINNLAVDRLTSLVVLKNDTSKDRDCLDASVGCARILAGTNKGVFILDRERWIPLYKGMETNKVSYLSVSKRGKVYAATARGIYFLSDGKALPITIGSNYDPQADPPKTQTKTQTDSRSQFGFDHEPSINEVHAWAIDYAEVNHEKISKWRVLARKKAVMPDLSVGLDRDASDMFHWNTGASPDELQKGRDLIDWDVSLSWDLADMVWSTDQTTIDSRSKLMVELREDILDEVTRLYFERRRVQIELMTVDYPDDQTKTDKELRIAELTALIDALTGGEFSRSGKSLRP